jgi:hypothetical protein
MHFGALHHNKNECKRINMTVCEVTEIYRNDKRIEQLGKIKK